MGKIVNYFKKITSIKDEAELSQVISKVSDIVDKKIIDLEAQEIENDLGSVIIKDEKGEFVDCCKINRKNDNFAYFALASKVVKDIGKKEEQLRNTLLKLSLFIYSIFMLIYTVFTLVYINTNLGDIHKELTYVFAGIFILSFIVILVINVIIYFNSSNKYSKQIKIMKTFKGASKILRRLIFLWSLFLSIYALIATWDYGVSYQILNVAVLSISALIFILLIIREFKKIFKRFKSKNNSKARIVLNSIKSSLSNSLTFRKIKNENNTNLPKKESQPVVLKLKKSDIKKINKRRKKLLKKQYRVSINIAKDQYLTSLEEIENNFQSD